MSDDVDKREDEGTEAPEKGPRGGERLANARRELQISVQEIAKELHLDEPKVRALERNEFELLGAPVFAKGHLRKYAELVNVSVDEVIGDYFEMSRAAEAPPVISTRRKPRRELSPGPWIAVIVIIIVAATAYWWFTRPAPPRPAATEAEPVGSEVVVPSAADEAMSVDDPGADDETVIDPTASADQPMADEQQQEAEPAEEAAPAAEIADGQLRMLLSYSGDCWTEVTDATGRSLFFKLGEEGRTVELSGAGPFNVLFGSPDNVSVAVNGEDYPLPASARPGRPLRVTIPES